MKRPMQYECLFLWMWCSGCFLHRDVRWCCPFAACYLFNRMDVVFGTMSVGRGWMWENGTVSFQMAYRFLSMHVHSGKRGFFFG